MIREYNEEMPVSIERLNPNDNHKGADKEAYESARYIIVALNESGCNSTEVDLIDVLKFVKAELPEIWEVV